MADKKAPGIYHGRLVTDGNGNLLAEEDDYKPVAYHEGSFIYLGKDEPSHNERHHQAFATIQGTTDAANKGEAHHLEAQPDDPHYEESAPNKTRIRTLADSVAATYTGHTDAYGGDE